MKFNYTSSYSLWSKYVYKVIIIIIIYYVKYNHIKFDWHYKTIIITITTIIILIVVIIIIIKNTNWNINEIYTNVKI